MIWNTLNSSIEVTNDARDELQQQIQELTNDQGAFITFTNEQNVTLFGNDYNFGEFTSTIKAKLSNEEEVMAFINQKQEGNLTLKLIPA